MAKIGVYYRVSTDQQELTSQSHAVMQWLREKGLGDGVKLYQDEGISGKTERRPGFQKLLKDAHDGKIDTIVVYRLDRFSRNASTAIRLLLTLDEAGVAFISVTQPVLNLGHDMPFRRTILAAFAEIAEIERDTIVARVKSGIEAAKKRGVKLGRPLKADHQKKTKAQQLKAEGKSVRQIATELKLSVGTVHGLIKAS